MRKILSGDFLRFGAYTKEHSVVFTFISRGEDRILLFDVNTKKLIEEIEVKPEFKRGRVCSLEVFDIDRSFCYQLASDKGAYPDMFSQYVIGRDIWGEKADKEIYSGFNFVSPNKIHYEKHLLNELLIYKLHIRGYSMYRNISDNKKGNYRGVIHNIKYLKEMGVNALELMPIYDFNEIYPKDKMNYWGYSDISPFFMAPKASYFGDNPVENAIEFINTCHKNDIAVILEFCFTKNMPGVISTGRILDIIRHWAFFYNVDGFRFIGDNVPEIELANDPYLSDKYLFFEDTSGISDSTAGIPENDRFMYPLRKLQHNFNGSITELRDIMIENNRINYVASHNGFTLNDVYSYSDKHNEDNGEDNRDGNNNSRSFNYGVEGVTRDKSILGNRLSAIRTALCVLMLSQGTPMICSGDEILNSALGNNNPYCRDDKIGWVNFSTKKESRLLREYFIKLSDFRKNNPILHTGINFQMSDYKKLGLPDLSLHGKEPWAFSFQDNKKAMAMLFNGNYANQENDILILFNFYSSRESFTLPAIPKKSWFLIGNSQSLEFEAGGIIYTKAEIAVPEGSITIMEARYE